MDWVLENLCSKPVAAGIDLPFPTQQILFHGQTEETDGDRTHQREGWPISPDSKPPRALNVSRSVLAMMQHQPASQPQDGNQNGGQNLPQTSES